MWRLAACLVLALASDSSHERISKSASDEACHEDDDSFALIQGRVGLDLMGADSERKTRTDTKSNIDKSWYVAKDILFDASQNQIDKTSIGKVEQSETREDLPQARSSGEGEELAMQESASETSQANDTTATQVDSAMWFWPVLQQQNPDSVDGTGMTANAAGDLPAFISAVKFNLILIVMCLLTFMVLQRRYPLMFSYRNMQYWKNGADTESPYKWDPEKLAWLQWAGYAWKSTREGDRVEHSCGLDQRMLLEYTTYAMQIMLITGIPALAILVPIYSTQGGGMAGEDKLSWWGVGNVIYEGSVVGKLSSADASQKLARVQWIWWMLAFATWAVVIFIQGWTYRWQRFFLTRRERWLDMDPEPHCCSILVEGIPLEYCTDAAFKEFMQKTFDARSIKEAFVVKDFSKRSGNPNALQLHTLINEYLQLDTQIHEKQFAIKEKKKLPADRQGGLEEEEAEVQKQAAELDAKRKAIKSSQTAVSKDAVYRSTGESDVSEARNKQVELYTDNGIVTFTDRKWCEIALGTTLSSDLDEWVIMEAPAQHDIIWDDLMVGDNRKGLEMSIGYGLLVGLIFVYMPLVLMLNHGCTAFEEIPSVANFLDSTGMKSTVDATLATIGLTIMTSMLPTFLMWIFDIFFVMKSEGYRQLRLQKWYFWFLIFFVLLLSAVGTNFGAFAKEIATNPFGVFVLFADRLPGTTHFFLNYVMLQPVTHSMNLTRYIPLTKYLLFKQVVEESRARELAEPEDQDYYGMGSRSSRFTAILIIGIVFGTICPLMNIVVFFNFFMCRIIYGYLIPYAETRKNDIGGEHWVHQLDHTQYGVLIYIILMVGILLTRAESPRPALVAAVSFIWWFVSHRKFTRALQWEKIPFTRVSPPSTADAQGKPIKKRESRVQRYFQKELSDDPADWPVEDVNEDVA